MTSGPLFQHTYSTEPVIPVKNTPELTVWLSVASYNIEHRRIYYTVPRTADSQTLWLQEFAMDWKLIQAMLPKDSTARPRVTVAIKLERIDRLLSANQEYKDLLDADLFLRTILTSWAGHIEENGDAK